MINPVRAVVAVLALLGVGGASAGPNGALEVAITLARPQSACLSRSVVNGLDALVEVACPSGEFVAIAPAPGNALPGARGAALPYALGRSLRYALGGVDFAWLEPDESSAMPGTVTALRVVDLGRQRRPIEMIVSF